MSLLYVGPSHADAAVAKLLTVNDHGFSLTFAGTLEEAGKHLGGEAWSTLVCGLESVDEVFVLLEAMRRRRSTFCIVYNRRITQDCKLRLQCFAVGAQMLANDPGTILQALQRVRQQYADPGPFQCHLCGMQGLGETALHLHLPLYHSMQSDSNASPPCCPICTKPPCMLHRSNYYVHLHNEHGPPEAREPAFPLFSAFAWVVCRRPLDGRFLLVHEPAGLCDGDPLYWLPAGRVDAGESFVEAGMRETLEEAGVQCTIKGVLQFMLGKRVVPRIVLYAEARSHVEAKSVPDFESCGALWVDPFALEQLEEDDCRSPDPLVLYPAVAREALLPQRLDTASFAALEGMVRRLTAPGEQPDRERCSQEVNAVWALLRSEYPTSCFSP